MYYDPSLESVEPLDVHQSQGNHTVTTSALKISLLLQRFYQANHQVRTENTVERRAGVTLPQPKPVYNLEETTPSLDRRVIPCSNL